MSADLLPDWVELVRCDNPGPMTLEGTNTYVLATGTGQVVVVDPGPLDEQHLSDVAAGREVAVALLTHGHPDHAEGAARFAELARCDVYALDPAHRVGGGGTGLADGQSIGLGELGLEVVLTPGHTGDSVCFVARRETASLLLTGDTILGRGTTVVAHPDGRLGPYLDSLRRLAGLAPLVLAPGHGPVGPDAPSTARDYLHHRAERLEQVRAALAAGDRTAEQVVRRVYADVDRMLWPAAELSVRAQLDYLRERAEAP